MQSLIQSLPHLSKNDLFNISLYHNKPEDIEYLLKHHKKDINIFSVDNGNFLLECIKRTKNVRLLIFVLTYGIGKLSSHNPNFTYTSLAKQFPVIIPYLISILKRRPYTVFEDKEFLTVFVDVALDNNCPIAMKALLDFEDRINEYRYTLLVCGAGDTSELSTKLDIVKEMPDECVETAYLCHNFKVLEYLRENGIDMNPAQKIANELSNPPRHTIASF